MTFSAPLLRRHGAPEISNAEALVHYGGPPPADGGVYFEIKRRILGEFPSRFTVAIVREAFPNTPEHTIRRVLNELRKAGDITAQGRGKGANGKSGAESPLFSAASAPHRHAPHFVGVGVGYNKVVGLCFSSCKDYQ